MGRPSRRRFERRFGTARRAAPAPWGPGGHGRGASRGGEVPGAATPSPRSAPPRAAPTASPPPPATFGAAFATIVPAEDVANGKPDPAGYLRALELLDGEIAAREVVVLEDTEPGIAAAKAAGMRVVAVSGTVAADRLASADAIADRLDVELLRSVLG